MVKENELLYLGVLNVIDVGAWDEAPESSPSFCIQ
jgi:hypothetical protein